MELTTLEMDGLLSYWNQTMPEADQAEVTERLRTDEAFRSAANETQLLVYAVRAAKAQQTRDHLTQFRRTLPPLSDATLRQMPPEAFAPQMPSAAVEQPFWVRRRAAILALAAAFAGILVVWVIGFGPASASRGAGLAGDYFEAAPGLIRKSGNDNQEYRKALRWCAEGDYKAAIPIFKRQFDRERDTMLLLQIGVAALGAGQMDQAIENLENARNHLELRTKASWFLAEALFESKKDEARAIQLLREVAAEGGVYGAKATDKLKQLGNQ